MIALISVVGTLVDSQGRILIDEIYYEVAPLLPEEEQLYKCITFDTVRCFARRRVSRTFWCSGLVMTDSVDSPD